MNVVEVARNGFCVGCGNCVFIDRASFRLGESSLAEIPMELAGTDIAIDHNVDAVCPFSDQALNEDEIAEEDYSDSDYHDSAMGYRNGIYVGWDNTESARVRSSSGGLATFLVKELMRRRLVDGAVVVVYDPDVPQGAKYEIVCDFERLEAARQSKYVVTSYLDVLDELKGREGRYVFVGIPCHVKSMKLLMRQDPVLGERISHTIAIFCAHQKTSAFREYIGWNLGVEPSRLKGLKYRVKKKGLRSFEYFYQAIDDADVLHEDIVTEIRWLDWGIGLFKLKACDFCDDVTGETADIIFGDAWVRPYTSDYRGTNVLVCRNRILEDILLDASSDGSITLIREDPKIVIQSQAANYRHRKEGVLARLAYFDCQNIPYPARRPSLFRDFLENVKRHDVYVLRYELAIKSHAAFNRAKSAGDLDVFFDEMSDIVGTYLREVTSAKARVKAIMKKILRRILYKKYRTTVC